MDFLVITKKPTSFKNPDKPTDIDLIRTNQPNCFQNSNVFQTSLCSFHLLTVTEFKIDSWQLPPKIINYQNYKDFDNKKFSTNICKFDFGASDIEDSKNAIFSIFNNCAPIKRKTYV